MNPSNCFTLIDYPAKNRHYRILHYALKIVCLC